ncbi:TPA: hypothetical protein ACGEYH_003746 [Providencia rettgeri]|uniref:hypothetical protein n=1 Tax=Providencia TaxID=586 RepID=UPI00234ADCD3|nr:hypothetical protein [Providencia sp. PROV259]
MSIESKEQLIMKLNNYIHHGYIAIDSYDDPRDEVATLLTKLHFTDEKECVIFCKKILGSEGISDEFLDSSCLSHLFDLEKEYALNYVQSHLNNIPAPMLDAVMDGLTQYSKTPFRHEISDDLISNVYVQYNILSKRPFYKKMLESSYSFFTEEYPKDNDVR